MVAGPHGITYYVRGYDEELHFDVDDPKKDKLTITIHGKIGFKEGQFATVEVPISEIPIGEITTKYYRLDDVSREWAGKISHGSIDFQFHLDTYDATPFQIKKKETADDFFEALRRARKKSDRDSDIQKSEDKNVSSERKRYDLDDKKSENDDETNSSNSLFDRLKYRSSLEYLRKRMEDDNKKSDSYDEISKQKSDPSVDQIQKLKDENSSLKEENEKLQYQLKIKQEEIDRLHEKNYKLMKTANKPDPTINKHIQELNTLSLSLQNDNQKLQDKINLLLEKYK